ncbi:hypothetical protein RJ641_012946 [Dillenia turbinata]|uniref:Uncharacterized protein n=1 Tax=Dillenia turbinata TaxID=194707 RepID=A0AAN8Z108_9MAGN
MKIKNKSKVCPSPSSSSSSTAASNGDSLSVLKMLPAAILTLASILSLEDREVLAYMITRSMKTTTSLSSALEDKKKKKSKNDTTANTNHKSPVFDCDCFDCYTSYWVRWDSSENRELIHHVIEAFEEHLYNGDQHTKNSNGGRGKKREKMNRKVNDKLATSKDREIPLIESSENSGISPAENEKETEEEQVKTEICEVFEQNDDVSGSESTELMAIVRSSAANNHKGLARKVLPDVLGLLNSRLWNLWSPNA